MIEAEGDLWAYPADVRCVTTNGIVKRNGELVMGAGIALDAMKRFPDVAKRLGDLVSRYGNRPFWLSDHRLLSFPTKHHWKDRSDICLIETSARTIAEHFSTFGRASIAMTRPGCGHGGLSWPEVRSVIEPILDDRFVVLSLKE